MPPRTGRTVNARLLWLFASPCARSWPWDAWFNAQQNTKVYFMFTSTPPRAHRLPRVLNIMRKQTRRPDRVILSIPKTYSRFGSPYVLPSGRDPLLIVNVLAHDAGPLSKYLGVMMVQENNAMIIIGDDDVDYGPTFIEDFVTALRERRDLNAVVTGQFDKSFGRLSPGVMAFAGVGCYAKHLRRLVRRVLRLPVPAQCFLADDVVATHYFKIVSGYKLYNVTRQTSNFNDVAIYRSNSSINHFHVANGNRVNLECERALMANEVTPVQGLNKVPMRLRFRTCDVDPEAEMAVHPKFSTGVGTSWWQTYWDPCVGCAFEDRIGPKGDGGKWICNPEELLRPRCTILSVGSSYDFRFEQAIIEEYGCLVHVYDHTSGPPYIIEEYASQSSFDHRRGCPRGVGDELRGWCYMTRKAARHLTYHRIAIGAADGAATISLASAVAKLKEAAGVASVSILKFDCEGCEFNTLTTPAALTTIASSIAQVLIELHFNDGPFDLLEGRTDFHAFQDQGLLKAARMHALWALFHDEAGLLPFHKEPNIQFSPGDCVELALINKKLTRAQPLPKLGMPFALDPRKLHMMQSQRSMCKPRKSQNPHSTCTCEAFCEKWAAPPPSRRPACFFFDFGVEIAQSALAFRGESNARACRFARQTQGIFSPSWFEKGICATQTNRAREILRRHVWPELNKAGFHRDQCLVTLVEPSRHFSPLLATLQANYPAFSVHNPRAAYQCDSDHLAFDDKPSHRSMKLRGEQVNVTTLNLNRMLWVTALKEDHVILKVDVEGGEYELLACLASSPSIDLVDQLLLERHDSWVPSSDRKMLNNAIEVFRAKGVLVSQDWP